MISKMNYMNVSGLVCISLFGFMIGTCWSQDIDQTVEDPPEFSLGTRLTKDPPPLRGHVHITGIDMHSLGIVADYLILKRVSLTSFDSIDIANFNEKILVRLRKREKGVENASSQELQGFDFWISGDGKLISVSRLNNLK